jgi:hypothetical protein
MTAKITAAELSHLAQEAEVTDPVRWGHLDISQAQAYDMIAASILEQFDPERLTSDDVVIMLCALTKLTVENFILNSEFLTLRSESS